jgi:signal transduction histidine kinase
MQFVFNDKLVILVGILCFLFLAVIILFIVTIQRNKKKWEKKLKELTEMSELLKQKEYALQASQDFNTNNNKYFSIISREIKKPFNIFADLSDVLLDEYDFLSNDEKISYIKQINDGISASINKIQNIFQWINLKNGNYQFNRQIIHISESIEENIKMMSSVAHRKKVSFQTDIEPSLYANTDQQTFNTILRNLFFNAVEASPLNAKIIVQAINTSGTIKISVQDFGSGVSEAVKVKLLSGKPHRFSKEIENDDSSAIGLLLIQESISRNGGELWLDSEINEGSKFTFTLAQIENKSIQ